MTHAPIAPSGLNITVLCPASVSMQAVVVPPPPSEEELEGVAAHWIAQRYAEGKSAQYPVGSKFTVNDREWTVDLDMSVGAVMYTNALGGPHGNLRLEDSVKISRIHPTQCWGTPDGWRMFPEYTFPPSPSLPTRPIKLIRVCDYKYGHRYVEVFECYQLVGYAAGVMERLGLDDNDLDLWLELILVQPRCYHRDGPVRVWRGPAHMIRAHINIAFNAAHEALGKTPRAATNENCIDCKARHVCKTLQYSSYALIEFSTSAEIVELPPEAIGQELAMVDEAIDRLKARQTGLAAQAEALLRQGKPIAFYHMESGQSRMMYRDDVELNEMAGLGDLLNIDLRKPQALKDLLVTPTQAIQLGVDEEIVKKYAHRPPAALKLTRDNSITARKVFSK